MNANAMKKAEGTPRMTGAIAGGKGTKYHGALKGKSKSKKGYGKMGKSKGY